jgi:protein O-GlcNAc transferase
MRILAPPGSRRDWVREMLGDRVEFVDWAPREKYLGFYNAIDVGLDTLPYNGHTTSLDSHWMGVPVVTMIGSTVVGRGGLSEMSNLGLSELVGKTEDDYVKIAVALAGDLGKLASLRASLRDRMRTSPLMDGKRFTREIEKAYRDMWRRWCAKASGAGGGAGDSIQ